MSSSAPAEQPFLPPFVMRHRAALSWLFLWLLCAVAFTYLLRDNIAHWRMGDPDDELRLVQVRDWMAGQSWFDITQYRMNPPFGGPMHWSRLVDVPVAFFILLFRLFMAPLHADQAALVVVPLLTFGIVLAQVNAIANRIAGYGAGVIAMIMTVLATPVLVQLVPMRIDHHGWQMVAFLVCVRQLVEPVTSRRAAAIIGAALAVWLTVSIEGLPFAIGFTGILALRWLRDSDSAPFTPLCAALTTLVFMGWVLLFATRQYDPIVYCDIFAAGHLAALTACTAIVVIGSWLASRAGSARLLARLATLALAGSAAGAMLFAIAPQCAGDAFSTLDPLVREYWYSRTQEGLPIWQQDHGFWVMVSMLAMQALAACWFLRRNKQYMTPALLADFVLLWLLCLLVALLLRRAEVYLILLVALLAAPLVGAIFAWARKGTNPLVRVGGGVLAVIAMTLPLVGAAAFSAVSSPPADAMIDITKIKACQSAAAVKYLNALPPAQLMTSLDMGPRVLVHTKHRIVASGHHHNQAAMRDVILAFTASPDVTKQIFEKRGVQYLVTCGADFEYLMYASKAPDGFWARLNRGERPTWLKQAVKYGPLDVWAVD